MMMYFPVFIPLLKCFSFSGMSPLPTTLSFLGHWNPTHLSRLISNLHEVFLDLVQQAWLIHPLSTSYGDFVPPLWSLSHFTVIYVLVFSFLLNYTLFRPGTRSNSLSASHGMSTYAVPSEWWLSCLQGRMQPEQYSLLDCCFLHCLNSWGTQCSLRDNSDLFYFDGPHPF